MGEGALKLIWGSQGKVLWEGDHVSWNLKEENEEVRWGSHTSVFLAEDSKNKGPTGEMGLVCVGTVIRAQGMGWPVSTRGQTGARSGRALGTQSRSLDFILDQREAFGGVKQGKYIIQFYVSERFFHLFALWRAQMDWRLARLMAVTTYGGCCLNPGKGRWEHHLWLWPWETGWS